MNIENLTDGNVKTLQEKLEELKQENPSITSELYSMGKSYPLDNALIDRVENIEKTVERIETLLKNIFGNNILIDGKFVQINFKGK